MNQKLSFTASNTGFVPLYNAAGSFEATGVGVVNAFETMPIANQRVGSLVFSQEATSVSKSYISLSEGVKSHNTFSKKPNTIIGFKPGQDIIHFNKHSKQITEHFSLKTYSVEEYVLDANRIIHTGVFVPELNAYVQLPIGIGKAKSAVVGIDLVTGQITTFHIKGVKDIITEAPSLNWQLIKPKVDLIGSYEHLGWKAPYSKGPKL